MLLPELREVESRSSLLRRASGRGNPHPSWSGNAENLELVLHFAERPKILESCSYPRPIVVNGCNHFSNTSREADISLLIAIGALSNLATTEDHVA